MSSDKPSSEVLVEARQQLYMEHSVQMLLSALLSEQITEIKPVLDADGMHFPLAKSILGESSSNILEVINKLVHVGILNRRFYEQLVFCPRCHTEIAYDSDYTLAGTMVRRKKCGSDNSELFQAYFCKCCQLEFILPKTRHCDLCSYSLNEELITEIERHLITPHIGDVLSDAKFISQTPGFLTGVSGLTRNFSITAYKGSLHIAIDVIQSDKLVTLQEAYSFYSKMVDVKPTAFCLIAVPGVDSEAKSFLLERGVMIVEGGTYESIKSISRKFMETLKTCKLYREA